MAGDPLNAAVWADADVYVGPTTATNPATINDPFGVDWELVGLLDGDAGFTQSRNWEVDNSYYAWGGILVRRVLSRFQQTVTFTALEDNEIVRGLIWPGSPAGKLAVPRPERIKIAFETREGSKVRRLISAFQAEVTVNGDITDNETDLTRYELMATIFPDPNDNPPTLFILQETDATSS